MSSLAKYLNEALYQDLSNRILSECSLQTRGINNLRVAFTGGVNGTINLHIHGDIKIKVWEDLNAATQYFEIFRTEGVKGIEARGLKKPVQINKVNKDQQVLQVFSIQITDYPACCAMKQANYFMISHNVCQETADEILDMVVLGYKKTHTYRPSRFIFNFVERTEKYDRVKPRMKAMLQKIEPDDNPEIDYQTIYNWAKKQAGYQELLCYNANSGNVIHTALVIPSNQE